MLVNKQQEWDIYQEQPAEPLKKSIPAVNKVLRFRCLVILIMLTSGAMFITMRSEAIVRAGYGLVQLKSQSEKIEKENDKLRLEIAKLKSPQRIQNIAANQLGMVTPQGVYCATGQGR